MKPQYYSLEIRWSLPAITISFAFGLLSSEFIPIGMQPLIILCATLSLCGLVLSKRSCSPTLLAILILSNFWVLGILYPRQWENSPKDKAAYEQLFLHKGLTDVEAIFHKRLAKEAARSRIEIEITAVYKEDRKIPVRGIAWISTEKPTDHLRYGDRIRFQSRFKRPRNFNNPGEFDFAAYLARRGVELVGYLPSQRDIILLRRAEGGSLLLRWIETIRSKAEYFIDEKLKPPSSGILCALILGKKDRIPRRLRDLFAQAGVAHVLAVSGLHIGMVLLITFAAVRLLWCRSESLLLRLNPTKAAAIFSFPVVLLYGALTGLQLPTIRALIMAAALLWAICVDRKRALPHALCLAALIILVIYPSSIYDLSFQLSFTAVLSIVYLVSPIRGWILGKQSYQAFLPQGLPSRFKDGLTISVVVSFCAIAGTWPIVARHFHIATPVGLLSNLVIVPAVGFFIIPAGLLALGLLVLHPGIASFPLWVAGFTADRILQLIELFASLPMAYLYTAGPTVFQMISFYILLGLVPFALSRRWAKMAAGAVIAALLVSVTLDHIRPFLRKELKIHFISVGQGNSTLVEFPGGSNILIDGGGTYDDRFDVGRIVVAPFLWHRGIGRIDVVVLTHPHPDHMNGLKFILRAFRVREFWTNGEHPKNEGFEQLSEILRKRNIPAFVMGRGDYRRIGGVDVYILHPKETDLSPEPPSSDHTMNNHSIVIRLLFGRVAVLLPADIEREAERTLLSQDLKSLLIEIPHHGSSSSSTRAFLEKVDPRYAVLSVGYGNPFRFPSRKVIDRYLERGIEILRTDLLGAITLSTDGNRVEISSFKGDRISFTP